MIFNNRVKYALVIYLAFVIILVLSKPKFFFKKDGNFKEFGTEKIKLTQLWLVLL